jgi:hypothetical protein
MGDRRDEWVVFGIRQVDANKQSTTIENYGSTIEKYDNTI